MDNIRQVQEMDGIVDYYDEFGFVMSCEYEDGAKAQADMDDFRNGKNPTRWMSKVTSGQ
ncbi:MAG: hypothetical protein KGI52_16360 [Burkholderiales bacterium]|nr:hypothetical protein [Burkholderiales bacterium]